MAETQLRDRLPGVFPRFDDFDAWIESHQEEIELFEGDIQAVKRSLQILHAKGVALDSIGSDFDSLGLRRGRDDESYRAFLLSLVQAFDGRGTIRGIKTAIAAGVLVEADDVDLTEDFDTLTYTITINDDVWSEHSSTTVRELADLSDPVGVRLAEPVRYDLHGQDVTVAPGESSVEGLMSASEAIAVAVGEGEATAGSISHLSEAISPATSLGLTTSANTKIGLSGHQIGNGNTLGDGK